MLKWKLCCELEVISFVYNFDMFRFLDECLANAKLLCLEINLYGTRRNCVCLRRLNYVFYKMGKRTAKLEVCSKLLTRSKSTISTKVENWYYLIFYNNKQTGLNFRRKAVNWTKLNSVAYY